MKWDLDVKMNLTVEVSDEELREYGPMSRKEVFNELLDENLTGDEFEGYGVTFTFFPGTVKSVSNVDEDEWDVNTDMTIKATISKEEFLSRAEGFVGEEVSLDDLSDKDILGIWDDILSSDLEGETLFYGTMMIIFFPVDVRSAIRTR